MVYIWKATNDRIGNRIYFEKSNFIITYSAGPLMRPLGAAVV